MFQSTTRSLVTMALYRLRSAALVTSLGLLGCGAQGNNAGSGSSVASSALAVTTGSVGTASTLSSAPELADLMHGLQPPRIPDGREGFRCDSTPTIANVTVCGKTYPSTIVLDWSDCAERPMRPEHQAPPAGADAGAPPAGGSTSAGTVAIQQTVTMSPADSCDATAKIDVARTAKSDVTTTHTDGTVDHLVASVSSDSERDPSAKAFSQTKTYDLTRTDLDSAGTVTRTTHTTGTLSESFDGSGATPSRTLDGKLTRDDGTTSSTLTVTGVVLGAPDQCRWPSAGTITESLADGTTRTLVFGATCGDATLDGAAITLPAGDMHLGPPDGDAHHR